MPTAAKENAPVHDRRWWIILIAESVLLLLAILVYLYLTAQSFVITCQKDNTENSSGGIILCTSKHTVLGIVTLDEQTITGMAAAAVADQCEGAACNYRIELYDNQGVAHPVEEEYTPDMIIKERLVKLLNQFVIDPTKLEITLREQTNWVVYLLPVVAIVAFVLYRINLERPKK
jgi:hypothetical protein